MIYHKYNKPIQNTIFNFSELVSDVDKYTNSLWEGGGGRGLI